MTKKNKVEPVLWDTLYKQPCGVGVHVDVSTHRQEGVNEEKHLHPSIIFKILEYDIVTITLHYIALTLGPHITTSRETKFITLTLTIKLIHFSLELGGGSLGSVISELDSPAVERVSVMKK